MRSEKVGVIRKAGQKACGKQLLRYLEEFAYRFNNRTSPDLFGMTVAGMANIGGMTYAKLVEENVFTQFVRPLIFSGYKGCFAMIGTAYVDDSADAMQAEAFVAAGFFCVDPEWKRLRRAWRKILKPYGIPYYRASDCRNLEGSFAGLKKKWGEQRARVIADKIRGRMIDLLGSSDLLIGFGFGVNMRDFWEVDSIPEALACRQWMRECHDYQAYGFRNIFGKIVHAALQLRDGDNYVKFVCDESTHYRKIKRAFDRFKKKYPELGERMLSLAPMDDKKIPELQMADFVADVAREMVTRHIETRDRAEPLSIEKQIFTVDCAHKHSMLRVLSGAADSMEAG